MGQSKTQLKRGGKRLNSGRKPLTDKKHPVAIYIEESIINKAGGKEKIKSQIKKMLYATSNN